MRSMLRCFVFFIKMVDKWFGFGILCLIRNTELAKLFSLVALVHAAEVDLAKL